MELFPNLPNDIGRDCLNRLRYDQFSKISTVCKQWNHFIHRPEFFHCRKISSFAQKLIVLAQSRVDPNKNGHTNVGNNLTYRLTLFEPDSGHWFELPPVPEYPDGLPLFCQLAAVGSDLIVIGGLNSVTWEVSNSVFIFDFLLATWRRGAQMPGVRRSLFGCTSVLDRTVYVAGGHDEGKNALKSVMMYDVANDEWTPLPDMENGRDECKALFHRGKLHVIGGYRTEMQGKFNKSADVFDFATWQWEKVRDEFLEVDTCPRTCTSNNDNDEDLYMCRGDNVVIRRGSTWQSVARLPSEVCSVAQVTKWHSKLLVIGSVGFCEPYAAFVLDLEKYTWTNMEMPENFSGHVQAGCFFEM